MPESTQHKLDRIRPPRVQITYDVETRGSFVKKELPFVVGIMADLTNGAAQKRTKEDGTVEELTLRDKKYMEIDRDNFNDVMKNLAPSVECGSQTYTFECLDDFSPIRLLNPENKDVNKEYPDGDTATLAQARAAYKLRTRLSDVVAKLDGNVKLQETFKDVLSDKTKREGLKGKLTELRKAIEPEKQKDSEGGAQ